MNRGTFIDGWFEANRKVVSGRSRAERKGGSLSLGRPALRGLYALEQWREALDAAQALATTPREAAQ